MVARIWDLFLWHGRRGPAVLVWVALAILHGCRRRLLESEALPTAVNAVRRRAEGLKSFADLVRQAPVGLTQVCVESLCLGLGPEEGVQGLNRRASQSGAFVYFLGLTTFLSRQTGDIKMQHLSSVIAADTALMTQEVYPPVLEQVVTAWEDHGDNRRIVALDGEGPVPDAIVACLVREMTGEMISLPPREYPKTVLKPLPSPSIDQYNDALPPGR